MRLLGSDQGERVGPGGSELWDGAKVLSKEARRGGENGPRLRDKDPDGEAGRGWSPASRDRNARFCFFKRRLLCALSSLPSRFLYRDALLSPLAYPEALLVPANRTRL